MEREGIRKSWKNNTFMITSNDAQIYHSKLIYVSELAVKFKTKAKHIIHEHIDPYFKIVTFNFCAEV